LRQRARWDRDALRIRFMMYGELRLFHRLERFPDTLQRLDFIVFDLVPTLSLPFYLVYIVLLFGAADAALFLAGVYVVLLWISIFNMALAFAMFNRSVGFFGLGSTLIFPLYQGVYLKCGRFFSYSSEIMFAASRYDDFVPPRVAVDGGGRREDEMAHAPLDGALDQRARVHRVVAVIAKRIANRVRHDDRGGEMDNGVDSVLRDQRSHARLVTDIADDERCALRYCPIETARKVVKNRDALAGIDERMNHVTSDIAGAAGNQDRHAAGPCWRSA
jgi:hypothetical protein